MNSLEVAKRIEKIAKQKGISGAELARRIGIDRSTINRYFKGTRKISMDEVPKFAEILDVHPVELLLDDNEYIKEKNECINTNKYSYFPVAISAGLPIGIEPIETVETITIPDELLGKYAGCKDVYFTKVNGESMNKVIPNGSLIAVKQIEVNELKNGDIVVYSNGYSYAVKRFYQTEDKLIFKPESTDPRFVDQIYENDYSEDLRLHGKVITYIVNLD